LATSPSPTINLISFCIARSSILAQGAYVERHQPTTGDSSNMRILRPRSHVARMHDSNPVQNPLAHHPIPRPSSIQVE
jgi:hypothetical protein